jgi:DNA-binding MarR family transcriptional regulator
LLLDVWVAGELVAALLDHNLEAVGVDPYAWGTLSVIGAHGPITPSELAEQTGRPPTTVSHVVGRLIERRDVERVPHPSDGRSYLLRVTKRGEQRWRKGWTALDATIGEVSSRLRLPVEDVHESVWELIEALREASRELSTKP